MSVIGVPPGLESSTKTSATVILELASEAAAAAGLTTRTNGTRTDKARRERFGMRLTLAMGLNGQEVPNFGHVVSGNFHPCLT